MARGSRKSDSLGHDPVITKNFAQLRGQEMIEHRCEVDGSGTCSGPKLAPHPRLHVFHARARDYTREPGEDIAGWLKALISPSQLRTRVPERQRAVPGKLPLSRSSSFQPDSKGIRILPLFDPFQGIQRNRWKFDFQPTKGQFAVKGELGAEFKEFP